jgi:catechol 2,3-dioxygenase-like lactoylglutathione lyase family enzyme
MFQTAIPVIQVIASSAAEEFYCKGLGFTLLTSWRPDEAKADPRYMTLARDGARLHVHSFQSGTAGAAAVYVFVDNVDALYAALRANGIEIWARQSTRRGAREIVVRDPDRNVLTFAGGRRHNQHFRTGGLWRIATRTGRPRSDRVRPVRCRSGSETT